jgi:biotin synthase-like enzyme
MEILMTIAVFRFMLPDRDIKLCGGKEKISGNFCLWASSRAPIP